MKKFNECKRDGIAVHYGSCLWLCKKPLCEHIQRYADVAFCNIPIKAEIMKNRENERKLKEGKNGIDK